MAEQEAWTKSIRPYDAEVGSLRRIRLKTPINEASALITVRSPNLLSLLGADQAWWLAHDEAGLGAMVSVVHSRHGMDKEFDESWQVATLQLATIDSNPILTDAEALAHTDGFVFVFGSSFVGPKGLLDERRSFVVRFAEHDVTAGTPDAKRSTTKKSGTKKTKSNSRGQLSAPASLLDLGTHLTRSINAAIEAQGIQLLEPHDRVAKQMRKSIKAGADLDPGTQPINIEGAAFINDDLLLGLRWPVSSAGQPLLIRFEGARRVLLPTDWSVEALADCPTTVFPIDAGGTPKRPAGVRGMTVEAARLGETVHLITGPTERDLAADKVRSAPYQHLRVARVSDQTELLQTELLQTFEGFRKVEAVAPYTDDTNTAGTTKTATDDADWIYALDDEDAIVLLIQD